MPMTLRGARPRLRSPTGHALTLIALCALGLPACQTPGAGPERERGESDGQGSLPPRTALDDYVQKEDASYSFELVGTLRQDGVTVYQVRMDSQTWRTPGEVDRTLWQHRVNIVVPAEVTTETALLLIGGGSNERMEPCPPDGLALGIARASNAVVVELGMVPNQPLEFGGDGRQRFEDDLIAYTWNRFLDTGDPTWAARLPMVKSAVRAMDTAQSVLSRETDGKRTVSRFVVAGGSKRGWTTWLTGAVDERVVGICPIVIDVVNVIPSMEHHRAAYGFWAPAVGDYERSGVMERRFEPRYRDLMELVDPYHYRHRLDMAKFVVNSAGDQFFLPDSSRFYYDDLVGEKRLRYVPNSDHGLDGTDAAESIQAWFQAVAYGTPRPEYSWTFEEDGSIRVTAETPPETALLWAATNPEARDFRRETIGDAYTSRALDPEADGSYVARVDAPARGWTAFFVELTWPGEGPNPLRFSTAVRVLPDVLPHPPEATADGE